MTTLATHIFKPVSRGAEVRLADALVEVQRPVHVDPAAEYREIGIRSHGRGIFHKDPIAGTDLGEKRVFWILPGDLVFNIVFAWEGAVALASSPEKGFIGSHRFPTYRVEPTVACPEFLLFFFQSDGGLFLLEENSPGAAGRNKTLDRGRLLKEKLRLPPVGEQRTIAEKLARRTAELDALVTSYEEMAELLQEKKYALVSQSMDDRGVRHTPRKQSSMPWLGEIPSHWNIERARYLFREVTRGPGAEDGVVTAFRDGQVTLRENRRSDGFTFAVQEVGYQQVREGELVIHSMDAFAGAIGVSESTGKCSPEYIILEPAQAGVVSEYFAACLRWMALQGFVFVICPSVRERAPRFLFSTVKDVWLPWPPLEEQMAIVHSIRMIDTAIRAVRRQIETIEGYRRSLINSTMRGTLDLLRRGAA